MRGPTPAYDYVAYDFCVGNGATRKLPGRELRQDLRQQSV